VLGVDSAAEVVPTNADIFKGASTVGGSQLGSVHSSGGEPPASVSTRKSYSSRVKPTKVAARIHQPRLPALDMTNKIYELRRRDAAAIRDDKDFTLNVRAYIATLQAAKAHVQMAWREWNPARSMREHLEALMARGDISLQVGVEGWGWGQRRGEACTDSRRCRTPF